MFPFVVGFDDYHYIEWFAGILQDQLDPDFKISYEELGVHGKSTDQYYVGLYYITERGIPTRSVIERAVEKAGIDLRTEEFD